MVHKITPNRPDIRRVSINENNRGARLVNRYVSQSPPDLQPEDLGFIVPNLGCSSLTLMGCRVSAPKHSLAGREASPKWNNGGRWRCGSVSYVQDWHWQSGWGPNRSERLVELAIRWLILAFAVWVAAKLVGGIHLSGWQSSLAVALILGLLNLYLR